MEALADEEHLTLLSARFEGFDERIVEHLVQRLDLGRAVRPLQRRPARDDRAGRDRAAASRGARGRIGRVRELLRASSRVGSSIRTTRVRRSSGAGASPTSCFRATTAVSSAGGRSTYVEKSDRPPDGGVAARAASHDRLARHDPRRDPDRARDQAVGDQPLPHPLELDGADAALRAARRGLPRLGRALRRLRPRARLPRLLRPLGARSAATSSSSTPRRARAQRLRDGRRLRQAADRPSGRDLVRARRLRLHRRQEAERALRAGERTRPLHLSGRRRSRPASTS